jgi:hypothetical protein
LGAATILFDHLVGERQQGGRDCEAEEPCGVQVDNEFKLVARMIGRSAGFSPFSTLPA